MTEERHGVDHQQHSTHVNPLGRRNHASLKAAQDYIDSVYDHPDVVQQRDKQP